MIPYKAFTGEFPRQQAKSLPDSAAVHALDCDFTKGNLIGIRERAPVLGLSAPAGVKSMFVYDGVAASMFAWTRDVNAVLGPVPNDQYSRFYWTDGAGFWVSRGDVGGNGQEPSVANKYKVGCPSPAVAPEIIVNESKLALPGVLSVGFALFCEGTDSSQEGMTALADPIPLTHTTNVWNAQWAATVSCATTAGSVSAGAGTAGTLTYYGSIGGFKLFYTAESGGYASLYFRNDDYLNQPLGNSIYVGGASDLYASNGPGYTTHGDTFYSVGSGWYCSNQDGAIPSGAVDTATVSAAVARTLAMKLTFNVNVGSPQTGILRLNGQHTLPAEFAKFAFEFNYVPGTAALRISGRVEYKEFRAYAISYTNQYKEESGLSYPTLIDVVEGQKVAHTLTRLADSAGYCPISFINLYRTANGANGTDYQLVESIPCTSALTYTYTDEKKGDELGLVCPTTGYEAPPQNIIGLCQIGNGILAGFEGSSLYFMEPYLPYAHRPQYIKPLPYKIISICPTDEGLYVTTTAFPYLITGVTPDAMGDRRVLQVQAGVSKGSICAIGLSVAYASHDGIVMLRGIETSLEYSSQFFTRETWRDLYANKLSVMRMNAHDGNILVWFEDGTPGFLLRTDESSPSRTKLSEPIFAAFQYPVGDSLYVSSGSGMFEFKGGAGTKPWEWHGKDFILPMPINFGCIQFIGSGEITYTTYADGVATWTETVTLNGIDSQTFRLPGGYKCSRWSIEIHGVKDSMVSELTLATSPLELKNG